MKTVKSYAKNPLGKLKNFNPLGKLKTLKKKVQKTHTYKNFVSLSRGGTRKQKSASRVKQ